MQPQKKTGLMLNPTPRVNQPETGGVSEITLRTLFETEETSLLRYAFSLTGRRALAEEVVQEVFLHLHRQWAEIESPRAWLYRSVRNRAFNCIRKSKKEVLSGKAGKSEQDASEQSPDALLEQMETARTVRQLIGDLDEPDREIVKLKYFDNLKYRDISEKTGLSVSNVGYRLHTVLKELACKLRTAGIDDES
ncbi:MAG: RNA polymerase sigma factor [Planctomycetales bacterium]|nr:RNA polymerase sigma factor [Planctomycetales bacterium]